MFSDDINFNCNALLLTRGIPVVTTIPPSQTSLLKVVINVFVDFIVEGEGSWKEA